MPEAVRTQLMCAADRLPLMQVGWLLFKACTLMTPQPSEALAVLGSTITIIRPASSAVPSFKLSRIRALPITFRSINRIRKSYQLAEYEYESFLRLTSRISSLLFMSGIGNES